MQNLLWNKISVHRFNFRVVKGQHKPCVLYHEHNYEHFIKESVNVHKKRLTKLKTY